MPELPDLQVFSHNLNKALKDKKLLKVNAVNAKKLNVSEKELKVAIEGEHLTGVARVGKELHFTFKNGYVLGLHLMLNGQLYLFKQDNGHKNTIIELLFDGGDGLALTDFQGIATPTLDPEDSPALDALSDQVDFDFLKGRLQKTRTAIKTVLLDQHVIRGIGNAYADEILWDARISPFSVSNKIPDAKIKDLVKSIVTVLKDAEKQIMKSHPDIISGEMREFLKVHNPKNKTTETGAVIHQKPMSSRKTYYTDEQELFS